MRTLLLLSLVLLVSPLRAQTGADDVLSLREAQQREWISSTRQNYQREFAAQEVACYQRFAVNDCLNESRRLRRELMADLRRQEILINDTQRKRRAARQLLRSDAQSDRSP